VEDNGITNIPWFPYWWHTAPHRRATHHPATLAMRATGSGKLNDHEAIVPSLKEVGTEPHCRSHAAATRRKEGRLGVIWEGPSNRWFHAMESMEVPMPLPVSLPPYSETL
jgi:hypothetical protein